jgi:hypothetical protein
VLGAEVNWWLTRGRAQAAAVEEGVGVA